MTLDAFERRHHPAKKLVDMRSSRRYIAAAFSTALLLGGSALAAPVTAKGAVLPSGSRQVGENRFRSPLSYVDTLKFYDKTYRSNPRKPIVNQPGLRGVHIANAARGDWEGLNVYELNGETRIFVVPRDPEPKMGSASVK